MSDDIYYRALAARDRRFEGRFIVAVKTTRIYCRPGCPAPTPRRENVIFLPSAAAAEEAGYRACRRCRPDAGPALVNWPSTAKVVARATRLISSGALDGDQTVATLAARLGMTERHLRRLFRQHLGASPIALAQTRRTHLARQLLDETSLPLTEIAFAAGFSSVRRFNEAFLRSYGDAPGKLRQRIRRSRSASAHRVVITLRLPYKPPFDWRSMLDFFQRRAICGLESVEDDCYRRLVGFGSACGAIVVRAGDAQTDCLQLAVPQQLLPHLPDIVERVRRLFDLDCDPGIIEEHLSSDRRLRPILRRFPGLRVPGAWDPFEAAVRAILGQQVSVAAATTMASRVVASFGAKLDTADTNELALNRLFPSAATLVAADLSLIQIPQARRRALLAFSIAAAKNELPLDGSRDLDETVARLTELPGIGEWTAQYIAMRALRDPDAFPAGDLGLRIALAAHGRRQTRDARSSQRSSASLTKREILTIAERWRPYRAYAARLLWKGLE